MSRARRCVLALLLSLSTLQVWAWELAGAHKVVLHAQDNSRVVVGSVQFKPMGEDRFSFMLTLDHNAFRDHFLSMREFKCVDGRIEILCHVPYPYKRPDTVTRKDFAWLEHALLFMFKLPSEFGAKLWNGVYFNLQSTDAGLVGKPQAIDLNLISAPPARDDVPPYRPALRDDIAPTARWFTRLTIE